MGYLQQRGPVNMDTKYRIDECETALHSPECQVEFFDISPELIRIYDVIYWFN